MLVNAVADKDHQAQIMLFDSGYVSRGKLKLAQALKRMLNTTLKSNRMVSLSKEDSYVHINAIESARPNDSNSVSWSLDNFF